MATSACRPLIIEAQPVTDNVVATAVATRNGRGNPMAELRTPRLRSRREKKKSRTIATSAAESRSIQLTWLPASRPRKVLRLVRIWPHLLELHVPPYSRAVAQPGSALVRDQEVGGSNPLSPICSRSRWHRTLHMPHRDMVYLPRGSQTTWKSDDPRVAYGFLLRILQSG